MASVGAGQASIWLCDTKTIELDDSAIDELLMPEDRSRSRRFAFDHLRRRYCVSRAAVRRILAEHLGLPPHRVALSRTAQGKPYVPGGPHFNVSHSGDWLLIAVSSTSAVGVDIEVLRDLGDMSALVKRYFSPRERQQFDALPKPMRVRTFFRCWTRKEALSKAVGSGLAIGFQSFSVPLNDMEVTSTVSLAGDVLQGNRWFVKPLRLLGDAESAIASNSPIDSVLCHGLRPDLTSIERSWSPREASQGLMG